MTSGRVRTSRSLLPFTSCGWRGEPIAAEIRFGQPVTLDHRPHRAVEDEDPLRRAGVECASRLVSGIEQSHRDPASSCSSCVLSWFVLIVRLCSRRNQHGERIPGLAGPDADLHIAQTGRGHHALQILVFEPQRPIAELRADPVFLVLAQIEDQDAPAGHRDPRRLGDGARRARRMVKRLRQQRHIHRRVLDRQLLELAALPDDVGHAAAPRQRAGALQHDIGPVHGDDPRRPSRGLDGQIAFATAEIRHSRAAAAAGRARATTPPSSGLERAAGRHACPRCRGCRSSPCAAAAPPAAALRRRAPRNRPPPARTAPSSIVHKRLVRRIVQGRRQTVIGEPGVLLLRHEGGLLQEPEVAGHSGLRQAENPRQLGDVETLASQHAQQPQPRLVAEAAGTGRRPISYH